MISVYINDIKLSEIFIKNSSYIQDLLTLSEIPNNEIKLIDSLLEIDKLSINILEKLMKDEIVELNKYKIENLIDICEFYGIEKVENILKKYYCKEIIPKLKQNEIEKMYNKKSDYNYLKCFPEILHY
jgi:hypothetical protein